MKTKLLSSALFIAFISISQIGKAQTATPVVKDRQVNQQERIGQGVKSGALTPKETEHLEGREAKIQQDKKAAKADGTVTPAEKSKLHREQDRTSRAIYHQKHDAQTRK